MKNARKQYLHAVADALTCTGKEKRKILGYLQDRIAENIPDGADGSLQMLEEQFGTPEAVAESVAEQMNDRASEKADNQRSKRIIVALVIVFAAILGIVIYRIIQLQNREVQYYYTELPKVYQADDPNLPEEIQEEIREHLESAKDKP